MYKSEFYKSMNASEQIDILIMRNVVYIGCWYLWVLFDKF